MSRNSYLIHCYYTIYSFRLRIKVALIAHRLKPALGDWCADRFGITAAYRRGWAALGVLPRTGNVI